MIAAEWGGVVPFGLVDRTFCLVWARQPRIGSLYSCCCIVIVDRGIGCKIETGITQVHIGCVIDGDLGGITGHSSG